MTAGWWIVTGTAGATLLLIGAALACRIRAWPPGRAATTVPLALGTTAVLMALASVVFALVVDDEARPGPESGSSRCLWPRSPSGA